MNREKLLSGALVLVLAALIVWASIKRLNSEELIVGAVAGVIAAFLWALIEWCRRRWRNHENFGGLGGCFQIRQKQTEQLEPEIARIRVQNNILTIEFEDLPDGDSVLGRIEMNESFRWSGAGHYSHRFKGKLLSGHWDLQVFDDDTLVVHTTYASHKTSELVAHTYVWTRIQEAVWRPRRSRRRHVIDPSVAPEP